MGKAVLTGGLGLALSGRSRKSDTITVTWLKGGEPSQQTGAPALAAPPDDKYDQLAKLAALKDKGILTDAEFQAEKFKLLGG